jgi:Predicted redox protein, regulator of disulfide bond formation
MAESNDEGGRWLEARVGPKGFRTDISTRHHRLTVDEPESAGGTDAGPTPYEYLLIAIASCTAMTLRSYADRKSWPVESIAVFVRQNRSHRQDCEDCEAKTVGIGQVERRIELGGSLTDEQRSRMLEIADRCPVKQTLKRGIDVVSSTS